MSSSLAARTLERATVGLQSGRGACLPELVKLIHALSINALQVPIQQLAEIIEKDSSILAKVIGAANTMGYNPGAVPIGTVTQAIHVIGFERVRTLAMSLLLIEQTQRMQTDSEQRESAALAICTGLFAQASAEQLGSLDPEQAFVCASLRNFGRIVLTMFMPDEFKQARTLSSELPSDEAYREIFGMTPLELGHALLKAAKLPDIILATLQVCDPEKLARAATRPETQLLGISDFSLQFAELAFDTSVSAKHFAEKAQGLIGRFKAFLPDSETLLDELLKGTEGRLAQFMKGFRIKTIPTQPLQRLKLRIAKIDPSVKNEPVITPVSSATLKANAETAARAMAAVTAVAAVVAPVDPQASWNAGIRRLQAMMERPGQSLSDLLTVALGTVAEGFETPEGAAFAARPGVKGFAMIEARGQLARASPPPVRVDERTVFGICLSRRENVLIHNASDPKIAPYLPPWLRTHSAPKAFVLMPLFFKEEAHGVVLVGWPEPRQIAISPTHALLISTLLGLVGQVCARNLRKAA